MRKNLLSNHLLSVKLLGGLFLTSSLLLAGCASPADQSSVGYQTEATNPSTITPKPTTVDTQNLPKTAMINTSLGSITLELFPEKSPKTVANFVKLAKEGFYTDTKFHRVIKDFMIQGGDPNSKTDQVQTWGFGGPGYQFEDEINDVKLVKGVLAMANAGPNTNGSQFFIVTAEATPWLDGKHTAFGRVTNGLDIVEKISLVKTTTNDRPVENISIKSIDLK